MINLNLRFLTIMIYHDNTQCKKFSIYCVIFFRSVYYVFYNTFLPLKLTIFHSPVAYHISQVCGI